MMPTFSTIASAGQCVGDKARDLRTALENRERFDTYKVVVKLEQPHGREISLAGLPGDSITKAVKTAAITALDAEIKTAYDKLVFSARTLIADAERSEVLQTLKDINQPPMRQPTPPSEGQGRTTSTEENPAA